MSVLRTSISTCACDPQLNSMPKRMIAILMLVIAAFPSADLAWFGAMRDQRRSIVFGILLAILVLEHALLYAFMQWWWTMPNTEPQLVRSRSRSPTRSRYG